jgi:hypothetical protein
MHKRFHFVLLNGGLDGAIIFQVAFDFEGLTFSFGFGLLLFGAIPLHTITHTSAGLHKVSKIIVSVVVAHGQYSFGL